MKLQITVAFAITIAASSASSYHIGQEYYLIPTRFRRAAPATSVKITDPGTISVNHQQPLVNSQQHSINANGGVSKNIAQNGPLSGNANINYNHNPSGGNLNLNAQKTEHKPLNWKATGQGTIFNNAAGKLDASASVNKKHEANTRLDHNLHVVNSDNHKLGVQSFASKNSGQHSNVGAKVQYQHPPSGSAASVSAQTGQRGGTKVGLQGSTNIYQKGPLRVDLSAGVNKQLGGPGGKPDVQSMLLLKLGPKGYCNLIRSNCGAL